MEILQHLSQISIHTKKSGNLAESGFYRVAGKPAGSLLQMITLLLVPLLLEQLQRPSLSYGVPS